MRGTMFVVVSCDVQMYNNNNNNNNMYRGESFSVHRRYTRLNVHRTRLLPNDRHYNNNICVTLHTYNYYIIRVLYDCSRDTRDDRSGTMHDPPPRPAVGTQL